MEANANTAHLGLMCLDEWEGTHGTLPVDVVLLTHLRDDADLVRLLPWTEEFTPRYRRTLLRHLRPITAEVIELPTLTAGLLFAPCLPEEMVRPEARQACRRMLESEAIPKLEQMGTRYACLGGLMASLTGYGRRLAATAEAAGITVSTGHSATAVSVYRTYVRAVEELGRDYRNGRMVVLGLGSVGVGFVRLLMQRLEKPKELVLVDRPFRREHLRKLAAEFARYGNLCVSVETTLEGGGLDADSVCYDCDFLVSAISSWNVIDIDRVAPGTVLVDCGLPACWSREAAWQRCSERMDIVPCEAGLVDCSSLGYRGRFPFGFAGHGAAGTATAWCCLTEGMILKQLPELAPTLGEPSTIGVAGFDEAFDELGLGAAALQCGGRYLPVAELREVLPVRAEHGAGLTA